MNVGATIAQKGSLDPMFSSNPCMALPALTIVMSTIEISFPGGKRVDASFDGQVVHTDQSLQHGGDGSAPAPFDLFLASLATCAGIYVLGFCQARGIPTDGVHLTQTSAFDAGRLQSVKLAIELPETFPEKYVSAVRAAAASCRVKKVLADPPDVAVEVTHNLPRLEEPTINPALHGDRTS